MRTSAKASRWRAYNLRRAGNRAADRAARLQARMQARAAGDAAEMERAQGWVDAAPRRKPLTLKLRLTIDGHSHQITTRWLGESWGWSLPAGRIVEGIRELMRHAPRIAGMEEEES